MPCYGCVALVCWLYSLLYNVYKENLDFPGICNFQKIPNFCLNFMKLGHNDYLISNILTKFRNEWVKIVDFLLY